MGLRVVELFAGVGGFRLGLQAAGHTVVWSNQWEPGKKVQHASDCYVRHFGQDGHTNRDISTVQTSEIPEHDLLVGGFPCQDYSVATTKAKGIEGKKGVLWWDIHRIAKYKRPPYLLLENVDRLLRSPTAQRGRDFGVLLRCLDNLGYRVEWRALNAADYSFPQKRRRTFIFAAHKDTDWGASMEQGASHARYLVKEGFFARQFPVREEIASLDVERDRDGVLPKGIQETSDGFTFHFRKAGVMVDGKIWTREVLAKAGPVATLGQILERDVETKYYVPDDLVARWRYLKGAKAEARTTEDGYEYNYTEGAIPFPDDLNQPSRTLLTGEGGTSPSRFKHIILDPHTQRFRVLTPIEAERLNGFPDGWTSGMPEGWRYFCMGNALVVGLVEKMGQTLHERRLVASAKRPA